MKRLALSLVFASILSQDLAAQKLPTDLQLRAWDQFSAEHQGQAVVQWNRDTGVPGIMYGFRSMSYSSKETPELAARHFLDDNRSLFRSPVGTSDLVLARSREDHGVHHIDFQQIYDGLIVLGGQYSVAVEGDNSVHAVAGRYYPDIDIQTEPTLSIGEAEIAALLYMDVVNEDHQTLTSRLAVWPHLGLFALVYQVETPDWEVLVNATTGVIEHHSTKQMLSARVPRALAPSPGTTNHIAPTNSFVAN